MMQEAMTIPALRKSILVEAPVEQAFRAFTEGIAAWWPLRTHSVAEERADTVVFESREGGRLYERTSDGEEHEWGVVLAWEPPSRVVYSWHPGRGDETSQEVEMHFAAEGDGTRVELEHRGWERLGERGPEQRSSYDSGWDYVLGLYVENAGR